MSLTHKKAIIIGGGPCGLATAIRLKQKTDITCTVYELRDEPTTLGGSIGILPNGVRLLDRLGVMQDLLARGSSDSGITVRSLSGHILGTSDMAGPARERTGGYGYLRIKRTDLMDVLLQAAKAVHIPIHFGKRIVHIDEDEGDSASIGVTFSDGTTATADMLLGCDGIHSSVRKLYVDPDQEPTYTGFSALGSNVPSSVLTSDQAAQVRGVNPVFTQQGVIAAMSCRAENDEFSWFLSKELPLPKPAGPSAHDDSRDGWEVYRREEVDHFKDSTLSMLEGAAGAWGDIIRTMVASTSSIKFYPIYKLPNGGRWSRGRCLLLGDAAHAMPPHAAQGTSMAIEDAFLLARLFGDSSSTESSLESIYSTFDKVRRPRIEEVSKQASGSAGIRKNASAWGLAAKQVFITAYLWASETLGLQKWMVSYKQMAYDVEADVVV